jgi:MATE family multidrug resistance protein
MIFALIGYWAIGSGVGVVLAFAMDWRGSASGPASLQGRVVAVLMIWRWTRANGSGSPFLKISRTDGC